MSTADKYIGCFLGLAIGDAYGAPYEGGFLEKYLWRMIGKTGGRFRYTDDTQMSLDIAHSFLECSIIDQDHLARTFAESYRWTRGYGPSAATLLKKIRNGAKWQNINRGKFKNGSYGNGAAMRAPIVAMCYPHDFVILKTEVMKTSEITHAHQFGIEGAQLIAFVTASFFLEKSTSQILRELPGQCLSQEFKTKVLLCEALIASKEAIGIKRIRHDLGNGIAAIDSCVTAIYFGLKYVDLNFDEMLGQIFLVGGDTDTIGAMAGAIWGAANGSSTLKPKMDTLENSEMIVDLARQVHAFTFSASRS